MIENTGETGNSETNSPEPTGSGTVRRRGSRRWVTTTVAIAAAAWLVFETLQGAPCTLNPAETGRGNDGQEPADGDTTASGFPTTLIDDVQQLFPTVARSTVKIVLGRTAGEGAGTGWILDERHVLTNWHVVNGLCDVACTMLTYDGATLLGTVLGTEEFDDIAVIRLSAPTDLPAIPLADSPEPVGSPVFFVGHPSVMGDWILGVGVVTGAIDDFVMTTLPIAEGASGSALLNASGETVGLISGCMIPTAEQDDSRDVPTVYSVVPEAPAGHCGGTNIERTMQFVRQIIDTESIDVEKTGGGDLPTDGQVTPEESRTRSTFTPPEALR